MPYTYAPGTTELLIRAYGVPPESCVGMDTAISTLKRGGKLPLPPFQPPIQPDALRSLGPIKKRHSVGIPTQATITDHSGVDLDLEFDKNPGVSTTPDGTRSALHR